MFSEKFKKLKDVSFIKTQKDSKITLDGERTAECVVCSCEEKSEALNLDMKKESLERGSKLAESLGLNKGQHMVAKADYIYLSDSQAAVVELKKIRGGLREDTRKEAFKQIEHTIKYHLSALNEDCGEGLLQIKDICKVKQILVVQIPIKTKKGYTGKPPEWKSGILYIYNENHISEEAFLKRDCN